MGDEKWARGNRHCRVGNRQCEWEGGERLSISSTDEYVGDKPPV